MPNVKFQPRTVNRDRPADMLPLDVVSAAQNVIPEDQLLRQAAGNAQVGPDPLLHEPRWLLAAQTDVDAYWIAAGVTGVVATDLDAINADITPAAFLPVSALTSPYTGGIIEQNPVVNARNSGPYWWDRDPLNVMQPLPDWPVGDLCDAMRPFREYLVAMNILAGGTRVPDLLRVSDAAPPGQVPQSWTPGVDSQAVERSVAFRPGGLVDGLELVDRFYIYKTSSVYLLQLIGGQFIFSTRPVFATFGALARNCVIEWRGQHVVLTDGDLIIHDGITATSLIDERVRREIFDNLNGANQENSYIFLNAAQEQVAVCRPRSGETYPTEAWVISLTDGTVGQTRLLQETPHVNLGIVSPNAGSLELTWAEKTTQWNNDPTRWNEAGFLRTADQLIAAENPGARLWQLERGTQQSGADLVANIERSGIALDAADRRKYCRRVWPSFEAEAGAVFTIEVGAHDHPAAPVLWGPPQPFTVGVDKFVNVSAQGYYLAYRVNATAQLPWRVTNMELEVEEMGRY